ncbi:hypothetical protein [Pseudoalteromonas tunicata]|jgi:hypothetical protein|uniref:Uncharacterized protein n=1 Tax=Pseudoalteromonas tunicata D2 TaxID=87626 RepID=A4CF57_9GAMM|nr:hypothetical protein [Pseudoalteromonas tunicata]ATC96236.1 hypothetical protein PTUN_a3995 [Pseudoalteromonas tunicata]EAR26605.1 hypothetical protein PTD2_00312 [Pseudoalteromonas tunicata D2]MDP4983146.1 hypothetical protein [Pseudoalteromonas tunicata]MDP5214612.1 hypothetical protein [Pseudoalteromonas tunicata]
MSVLLKSEDQRLDDERRFTTPDLETFWHVLTLAQKLALNKLNQYGYQLAFTRASDGTHLAIAVCDNVIATIDYEGEVNLNPSLKTR